MAAARPADAGQRSTARELLELAKPRLSALVVFTYALGFVWARGHVGALAGLGGLLGTTLLVAGANALNSLWERDVDAQMHRTRLRPLVRGSVSVAASAAFAGVTTTLGLLLLLLCTNGLTLALGALAWISYVLAYTPLKRRSSLALVVGAVPGALPPLMGWTSVAGQLDAPGLWLFAVLFAWQLPHFIAISVYLQADYARAGLRVFAVVFGRHAAKVAILLTSLLLAAVSLWPAVWGSASLGYAVAAGAAGAGLAAHAAYGLLLPEGPRWARQFFLLSLIYLPLVLGARIVPALLEVSW